MLVNEVIGPQKIGNFLKKTAAAGAIAGSLLTNPSAAVDLPKNEISQQQHIKFMDLIKWIENNTDYKYDPELVFNVSFVSHDKLCSLYTRQTERECKDDDLAAIYLNKTIFLHQGYDYNDPLNKSYVLHELAQLFQHYYGDLTDYNKADREAYALQAKYLKQHGLHQEALMINMMSNFSTMHPDHFSY